MLRNGSISDHGIENHPVEDMTEAKQTLKKTKLMVSYLAHQCKDFIFHLIQHVLISGECGV